MRRLLGGGLVLSALALAFAVGAADVGAGVTPKIGYMLYCSGCHGMDGTGSVPGGIPGFDGVVGSFTDDADGRLYMANVPGVVSANVDAAQTAEILNYVVDTYARASFQPQAKRFDAAEVAALWAHRPADVVELRRKVVKVLQQQGKPVPADYPWP